MVLPNTAAFIDLQQKTPNIADKEKKNIFIIQLQFYKFPFNFIYIFNFSVISMLIQLIVIFFSYIYGIFISRATRSK